MLKTPQVVTGRGRIYHICLSVKTRAAWNDCSTSTTMDNGYANAHLFTQKYIFQSLNKF